MANITVQPKQTKVGNSYWGGTGAYQEEYKKLSRELVPSTGEAETLNGELLRAIGRLGYEYNNNGNGNATEPEWTIEDRECDCCGGSGEHEDEDGETCDYCGGSGEISDQVEGERRIDQFYSNFLKLIEEAVPSTRDDVRQVEQIILTQDNSFATDHQMAYSSLIDKVLNYVLTNDDKEKPKWYTD